MYRRSLIRSAAVAGLLPAASRAQWFPSKQLRMVVGAAAGGGGDIVARILAQELTKSAGLSVMIDNKPGAGGTVATREALRAPPDGHTLMMANVGVMAAGAVLGVPLGTYLLGHMEGTTIRWAIVGVVVVLLALLMSGWRYHGRPHPSLTAAVGLTSGLFSGAAQVGGPPVVAYWLGGNLTPQTVRANIVLYFAISSLLSVASYLVAGILTWETVQLSLMIGPAFAVGLFSGARLFNLTNEVVFRRICFSLIAAAAIIGLPVLDGVLR